MGQFGLADVASDSLKFITFEGGDGSGKTTQVRQLADALSAVGGTVVTTREPGGTPAAEDLRALLVSGDVDRWDPRTEALLHQAARIEHIRKTIKPALDNGSWVLCDRFVDSTLAYQGYGHGVPLEDLAALQAFAVGSLLPELTLMLDVPLSLGESRTDARDGVGQTEDRYERMNHGFRERVHAGFGAIAKANPNRITVVDATADPNTVHAACVAAVLATWPECGLGTSL